VYRVPVIDAYSAREVVDLDVETQTGERKEPVWWSVLLQL
jgi:hypothetical protein